MISKYPLSHSEQEVCPGTERPAQSQVEERWVLSFILNTLRLNILSAGQCRVRNLNWRKKFELHQKVTETKEMDI